ncbi:hypothetical protein DFP72DRAFT_941082 [Ephemerocybe angulata]|uniref:Uncharacterized protein n=1 Tax=Ephemerocybe angulata TaxID=980116 RepID=A0A8H6LTB1_9AGAR|nr:hypothetical protein DFP72DRAFT_941082 [Tulosesus angulatus]
MHANPIFTNVTHLVLDLSTHHRRGWWAWDTLSQFNTLTHLCLCVTKAHSGRIWLLSIVPHFPSALRVCVVYIDHFFGLESLVEQIMIMEDRIVVALDEGQDTCSLDRTTLEKTIWWYKYEMEGKVESDGGFWRRAEAKVAELKGNDLNV